MTELANLKAQVFLHITGISPSKFLEVTRHHEVPQGIALGVIRAESSGNPGALRFEPGYQYLHDPTRWAKHYSWTRETEEALQSFSYGLMQIMLATARSLGFTLHPKELFIPEVNLSWGCLYLSQLFKRHSHNWTDAVAAYNWGHPSKKMFSREYKNQAYVDKVFSYAKAYRGDEEYV